MLSGYYESSLVLVSVLVAVLASYTALSLAERVSHAKAGAKWWWVAGGAFAMGTGIWSMHFIGMLAFRLPIALGYDLGITLLSWLLPIASSGFALWLLSRPVVRWNELGGATVLIGLGINAMHYVGMAAMRMAPDIVYDPAWVAVSIVIAIGAAGAALWIASRLRHTSAPRVGVYRVSAAVVMGLAIVGMHYTGMKAADFPLGSVCRAATGGVSLTQLATLVIIGTVAVLSIALLMAVHESRLEARNLVVALSQQATRERQTLLERERELRADAERLSELKDQFLATLSHELRTPLSAVLGWAQVLRSRRDDATLLRGLDAIERNARLQSKLIDDLLDTSRIVSGGVLIEPERIDPSVVLESAVQAMRPAAALKSIRLECSTDAEHCRVHADPVRLQQVLWNLLSNALKFTPEGGKVKVALTCREGAVQFVVTDTGVGIEPAFLPHAFERFRQADASTTRRHGGLGLGLSIVRELVQLHGGSVVGESAGTGRGTTFTVQIPAVPATVQERGVRLAPATGSTPVGKRLDGMQVLVVDDEADAREMLQQLLSDRGATVRTAASASAALQALREGVPHVLVSDIGMPETDGFGLIRQIRADVEGRVASVKAVALTAFTSAEHRERAIREGFDDYVPKPVDAEMLVRTLCKQSPPAATSP